MKRALIVFATLLVAAFFIFFIYHIKTISGSQTKDISKITSATSIAEYVDNCARCHGRSGEGFGDKPPIANTRLNVDEIKRVIQNGLAKMPAFQNIKDPTLSEIAEYVRNL